MSLQLLAWLSDPFIETFQQEYQLCWHFHIYLFVCLLAYCQETFIPWEQDRDHQIHLREVTELLDDATFGLCLPGLTLKLPQGSKLLNLWNQLTLIFILSMLL